jgi:hypothetical protein
VTLQLSLQKNIDKTEGAAASDSTAISSKA